jgi:hypothetical protein
VAFTVSMLCWSFVEYGTNRRSRRRARASASRPSSGAKAGVARAQGRGRGRPYRRGACPGNNTCATSSKNLLDFLFFRVLAAKFRNFGIYIFMIKLYKIGLWINLEHELNKKRGNIPY